MSSLPPMISHSDLDLGVSVEVPQGWEVGSTEVFPLIFFAPERSGYRTNLGFAKTAATIHDPTEFEAAIANTKAGQQEDYPRFQLLSEDRIWLDGLPAYLQTYQWQPEGAAVPFTQVLAVVVMGPEWVYELHGATLQTLAEQDLPILLQIVRSLRVLQKA